MANKPCTCGSEPIPGTDPSVVIYLSDLYKGNFSIGNILPIARSPIFLSLASDFCASSPRSNYFAAPGLSKYLFARAIDAMWAKKCRCKRDLSGYIMTAEYVYRVPKNPLPNRDYSRSNGIAGMVVNTRVAVSSPNPPYKKIDLYGYRSSNNYSAEVLIYSEQQFLTPGDSFEFKSFSQVLTVPGCPGAQPSPSTPAAPIAYPSVPRSPVPTRPRDFYLPELPPKKRVGLPPKPPIDECCDCC